MEMKDFRQLFLNNFQRGLEKDGKGREALVPSSAAIKIRWKSNIPTV